MAEILSSRVQHSVSTSAYVTGVCPTANGRVNFGSNSEETEKKPFAILTSKDTMEKAPTENDDGEEDHEADADEKEEKKEREVRLMSTRNDESFGMISLTLSEPSDEDEALNRRFQSIALDPDVIGVSPTIQVIASKKQDESNDDENFQTSNVQPEDSDTRSTDLTYRGPHGRPTTNGNYDGSIGAELCDPEYNSHRKYLKPCPSVSNSKQHPQYVAPLSAWNYNVPFTQFPSLSTFPGVPNGHHHHHHTDPSLGLYHPTPLPSINVMDPASVPRTLISIDPSGPGLNTSHAYIRGVPDFDVTLHGSAIRSIPTQGYPVRYPQNPIQFGQMNGFSASDDLDLASEYVKEQLLEERANQMNNLHLQNLDDFIHGSTPLDIEQLNGNDIAAVCNGTDETKYRSTYEGILENRIPRSSPITETSFRIPSALDAMIFPPDIESLSKSPHHIPITNGLDTISGVSGSTVFQYHSGSVFQPVVSQNSREIARGQKDQRLASAETWNCERSFGSLSPDGSSMSERSGRNVRNPSETGSSEKSRSLGPPSVGSVDFDAPSVSPFSTAETESSGEESSEERQSKMAEAEKKAESYEEKTLISQDSQGDTPLHLAMVDDDWYLVEALLNRLSRLNLIKQVINVPNKLQQTPLCLAVIFNKSGIVEKLIENGADVNVHIKTLHDKLGPKFCQPLHLAASRGQFWKRTLRELIKAENIDLNAFNSDGKSALHCAIESHGKRFNDQVLDCKEILRLLAEKGANLNQPDCGHEKTPLHYAIERRDVGLVSRLLCLASTMASGCEQSSVSQMLEAKTGNGNTALHLAASVEMNTPEHKKMLQQLMCKGADPSLKNSDGFLPRELTKNREIVELLKGRTVTGRSPYSGRQRNA